MIHDQQLTLGLPPPPATEDTPLIPVRMINEWVYCPRLAYLEWVEGEWADSGDTAEGRRTHVRVDEGGGRLPAPEDLDEEMARARAVTMSSERLGIIAKMDVVEAEGGSVTPVDFKKGKRPHVAAGAYDPERVQVSAQAMILEDNGYTVDQGGVVVRGLAREGSGHTGRGASRSYVGGNLRFASGRDIQPPAPATRKQPQVSAMFTRRNLPPGRDQPLPEGPSTPAAQSLGQPRIASLCSEAGSAASQERRAVDR